MSEGYVFEERCHDAGAIVQWKVNDYCSSNSK